MSTPVILTDIEQVNSTSYADVAGLLSGMDRIHAEPTDAYVERIKTSHVERKDHTYEGLINTIAFSLGLSVTPGISISGPDDTMITCNLSGISLVSGPHSLLFPLAVLGDDDVWNWNTLSQAVAAINATGIWQAELQAADGPAVQVCKQTNSGVGMPYEIVVSEVGIIGLMEPSLQSLAITKSGGLAYQMREFLQNIMQTDQSYWPR